MSIPSIPKIYSPGDLTRPGIGCFLELESGGGLIELENYLSIVPGFVQLETCNPQAQFLIELENGTGLIQTEFGPKFMELEAAPAGA